VHPRLFLDFETRSELDLKIHGLGNYARHASTQVLMLAYAVDEGEVHLWEPHLGPMPEGLKSSLISPFVTKIAWNVPFEHNILRHKLELDISFNQWIDPQVRARMLSMPGKLDVVCKVLGLPEDLAKDPKGKLLKKIFCGPAKLGGEETLFGITETWFHDWITKPKEWEEFCDYCRQDLVSLREIAKRLEKFALPDTEVRGWLLDQKINERGLPVDMDLVRGTTIVAAEEKVRLRAELKALTQVENPNSNPQMLAWVQSKGYPFSSLAQPLVKRALAGEGGIGPEGRQALLLRKQTAKTSDSKLETLSDVIGSDGRLRHQYVYMGAGKTGRWASYHVQMANLPRPTKEVEKNLGLALELLKANDRVGLLLEFPNVLEVVSSCIRSLFKAGKGKQLLIADLSAIENRMIGWLAECDSILRVFREGRDPYLDFAALIYNIPYGEIEKGYKKGDPKFKEMRQQAKPAVLGCGYRLSGGEEVPNDDGDIIKTGLWGYAAGMGITMTQADSHRAVEVFRDKYREIVNYWYALEDAAKNAMHTGQPQRYGYVKGHQIPVPEFRTFGDKLLRITLPSGRGLHYIRPQIELLPFRDTEKETLTYEGVDAKTKQWTRLKTHGGKLLENLSQAVSRDILLNGLLNADARGFDLIGHVHDEIIAEHEIGTKPGLEELIECMTESPSWAVDLPLGADGFASEVYRK
jgi:DNA polymerase